VCLDIDTGSGRFHQLECRGTNAQKFYIGNADANACVQIFQERLGGRLFMPRKDEDTFSEMLGFGADPVVPAGCRIRAAKVRWSLRPVPSAGAHVYQIVNQATGACLQAVINDGRPQRDGVVNTIGCAAVPNQYWKLNRIAP
jgi:hypothetical protein